MTPYEGRCDATSLSLSLGDGNGNFNNIIQHSNVLIDNCEVRDIKLIHVKQKPCLIIAKNNDKLQLLEIVNADAKKK